ncbi:portal vertex protein of the head [Serratia phage phiMAM1]|uniref:Portal protein n=2 Tax=Miltonvirus TaxID=2841278 RepID=K7YGS9_9CAUD|nr:portal vertex protein of the head [Serratia phage phiMAM1]AFX93524.1 portal vertex protein of the head [Serratia phage phiMAM1]BAH15167.1 portal protein [Serratia phage KSP90]
MLGFFNLYGQVKSTDTSVKTNKQQEKLLARSTQVATDDAYEGTVVVEGGMNNATMNGVQSDLQSVKQMVEEYQSMAQQPEVEEAVDIIINDVITCDEDEQPVSVNLERVEGISEQTKEIISEEFKTIMRLMDFENTGYDKIKKWYVDGRQCYQVVVDDKNEKEGIKKIIMLDSRTVRPVMVIEKEMRNNIEVITKVTKKYYYNPNNVKNAFTGQVTTSNNFQPSSQELTFEEDAIVYVDSGIEPLANGIVPGFLNPAIRPLNNLVTTEDATVIYAITRAPEKRAFYLDVGQLGKKSAEEYMAMMMGKFKNNLSYNRQTGKVQGDTHLMGIAEDYWMPRREGQNATEISTIGGGDQLGQMDHVNYFRGKLYGALKIPKSRLDDGGGNINIGGSDLGEITREENRFKKFCARLRRRYALIFLGMLRRQLIMKRIVTEDDWEEKIRGKISFDFASDNFVTEQQDNEILASRMSTMAIMEPYVGSMFSRQYIQKNILRMSEEEIKEQQAQIEEEKKAGVYPKVDPEANMGDNSPLKYRPEFLPRQSEE